MNRLNREPRNATQARNPISFRMSIGILVSLIGVGFNVQYIAYFEEGEQKNLFPTPKCAIYCRFCRLELGGVFGDADKEVFLFLVYFLEDVLQVLCGATVPEHMVEQDDISVFFIGTEPLEQDSKGVGIPTGAGILSDFVAEVGIVKVFGCGFGFREWGFGREDILDDLHEVFLGNEGAVFGFGGV